MAGIVINRARVDLLEVSSTIEPLLGRPRNAGAPFEFLATKGRYNYTYGTVHQAPLEIAGGHPVSLKVSSVCDAVASKNFWIGGSNPRVTQYPGYLGGRDLKQAAWDFMLPFCLDVPVRVTLGETAKATKHGAVTVWLWSCGWSVCLTLELAPATGLESFAWQMIKLGEQKLTARIGAETTVGSPTAILAWIADWVRRHVVQPIFAAQMATPTRSGTFTLVTVRDGSPSIAQLDADSQRLIYAATSRNSLWRGYGLEQIQPRFKELDRYPGSFVYMEPMARFVWFPSLMGKKKSPRALDCYVENTLAASAMMMALAQLVQLVTVRQTGDDLKASPTMRNLYQNAIVRLEAFRTAYQNTTLKRLAADLHVTDLVAEAKKRLR